MIVTCPECHAEYRLDPAQLHGERKVKCTQCFSTWMQKAEGGEATPRETPPAAEAAPVPADVRDSFDAILKETAAAIAPVPRIPESLMPAPAIRAAGPVYRLMNMSAAQFGVLTFLLCCFVSFSALLLAKTPLARTWPALSTLYTTLGMPVAAPGEGLRIDQLIAETRVGKEGRALILEGRLSNMTEETIAYPDLEIILSSAYGAPLKTWTLDNKDQKPLAPGEAVPVKLEFKDAPEGGTDIEMKVVGR